MEKLEFEIRKGKLLGFGTLKDLPDGQYKITEVKRIRSLKSNRYYWGYVLKYIVLQYKDFGYIHTTQELHKIFKKAFVPRVKVKSDYSKKFIWKEGSTASLNTKQFSDYIKVIEVIFEFGEMEKLGLEKIDSFVIPNIDEEELLNWIDKIV